jgi:glycosyltransferase involved in cell wall biosynthesis
MSKVQTKWPKISFVLLTFNDGNGVRKCIKSVKKQDYPRNKIEIIVVDNGSTDNSVSIAKKLGARVFIEPEGTLYSNWVFGLHKVTGEYMFYLEQDIVLRGKNFIKEMIKPMLEDTRIIATFTKEYPKKDMHWVTRFLSYHYSQCDPLLELLFDKLENKFVENHKKYKLCEFDEKLQPACRMFYRIKYLKKTPNWKAENYFDHDFVINCVRSGFSYFAYVPEPGYYHYHVQDFKHFLQKRVRNMHMHYFDYYDKGDYITLNTKDKCQVIKLIGFVIYANSFILPTIRGFIRFLKHKDWVLLTEPIITIGATDALLLAFLKDKRGRRFISELFKTAIGIETHK